MSRNHTIVLNLLFLTWAALSVHAAIAGRGLFNDGASWLLMTYLHNGFYLYLEPHGRLLGNALHHGIASVAVYAGIENVPLLVFLWTLPQVVVPLACLFWSYSHLRAAQREHFLLFPAISIAVFVLPASLMSIDTSLMLASLVWPMSTYLVCRFGNPGFEREGVLLAAILAGSGLIHETALFLAPMLMVGVIVCARRRQCLWRPMAIIWISAAAVAFVLAFDSVFMSEGGGSAWRWRTAVLISLLSISTIHLMASVVSIAVMLSVVNATFRSRLVSFDLENKLPSIVALVGTFILAIMFFQGVDGDDRYFRRVLAPLSSLFFVSIFMIFWNAYPFQSGSPTSCVAAVG